MGSETPVPGGVGGANKGGWGGKGGACTVGCGGAQPVSRKAGRSRRAHIEQYTYARAILLVRMRTLSLRCLFRVTISYIYVCMYSAARQCWLTLWLGAFGGKDVRG